MFCRIGEYISLDQFNFVNLTSCSLIPRIQLSQAWLAHCQEFPPCYNFYHPGPPHPPFLLFIFPPYLLMCGCRCFLCGPAALLVVTRVWCSFSCWVPGEYICLWHPSGTSGWPGSAPWKVSPGRLAPVPSQELLERCWSQRRTALGTPDPDFSSGFTPEAFHEVGYGCKAEEVWDQGFASPRWATNQG